MRVQNQPPIIVIKSYSDVSCEEKSEIAFQIVALTISISDQYNMAPYCDVSIN